MAFVPSPLTLEQTRPVQAKSYRFSVEKRVARGLNIWQGDPCRIQVYDPISGNLLAELDTKLISGTEVGIPKQFRNVLTGPKKFRFRVTPLFTIPSPPQWGQGYLL